MTLAAVVVASGLAGSASAQPDEAAAQRAAREIADAQDHANRAAAQWSKAGEDLEARQAHAEQLDNERVALEAQVTAARTTAEHAATERFMASSDTGTPIVTGYQQPFDQFEVAQRDLRHNAEELASARADVEAQQARYEELSRTANDEVEHLEEVEAKRLADERVRLALEAQRREEQRRVPVPTDTPQPPAAVGAAHDDTPVFEQPSTAPADPGMSCPVQGLNAYSDTWGAPRPGGRRHEGVDMISPKGTPLVAVASGAARFWTNSQGALGVSLTADDGTRSYSGHLPAHEGSASHVNTGQVIGYVGATGATTVNHLPFEVHPGGGAPVNPYPYVRNAGC